MGDEIQALLAEALRAYFPPKPRLVWQWAEDRRRIAKSETAKPGRYRVGTAPYQREPQESFTDQDVQTTVLYMAKRLGKTEMINNLHGATIDENPRNILHVMPTIESRNKWSRQMLGPMIESTETIRAKIVAARARKAGNTVSSKSFPGGAISGIGSNAPSGFRQVQAPVVTCDEVDAMEDVKDGGAVSDPVFLAFGRTENYEDSVQVVASTATKIRKPKPGEDEKTTGSRIHDWWKKSDQRRWFVKCPVCAHRFVMDKETWGQLKWPKKKVGEGVWEHQVELAYFECPGCQDCWDDAKRLRAIAAGEWRATAPFSGVRGYHLSGMNTVFAPKKGYRSKLHQMAAEFLDAHRSGEAALTVWTNTFLCEPVEEKAERLDPQPLLERREAYDPRSLPAGCLVVTVAVDVQGDRLEADVWASGEGDEAWGVEHRKLMGNPEHDQVWRDLTALCLREYRREDGVVLKPAYVAVDLGHKPKRVRAWLRSCGLPRVYGVYGTSGKQVNLVIPKYSKHYRTWSYSVNTDLAKDIVFARLRISEMGPRYMHFGREQEGFDAAYFDQLTAEEKKARYVHGRPVFYYEKVKPRNEALDQQVYRLAALDILPPNYRLVRESLLKAQGGAGGRDYTLKPEAQQHPRVVGRQAQAPPAEPRKSRVIGGTGGQPSGAQGPKAGGGTGNLGKGSYVV